VTIDLDLQLDRNRARAPTLVDQLVRSFADAIEQHRLRSGTRLPSVRKLAQAQALSAFTVGEAYNRLVSMGLVVARRGSGYRVSGRAGAHGPRGARADGAEAHEVAAWEPPSLNASWLLSDVFADHSVPIKAGCGWLPGEWVNESGLKHALRAISRLPAARFGDYGHPYGFAPLRERIATELDRYGLAIDASNVLMTQGATQALDLIVRTLLRAGDTVVVEDPGYCNLLQILKLAGLTVLGVPRTPAGIDADALEALAGAHRPKALFVNTTLQNPTGATLTMSNAFRVMQIAERHRLWIIEDDVNRELTPHGAPMLAAMEGLSRVLYVGGFAKTISPSLRCGYVAAERDVLRELARTKMAVGLTSCEAAERIVDNVLVEGRYARHVERITDRLKEAHARVEESMDDAGFEVFARPQAGLFLFARLPKLDDEPDAVARVTTQALEHGIWLAPGSYFRPHDEPSSWFRFNVPYAQDDALWRFLRQIGR
jgi:DNA-binding transcriptional MocR family regulator